MLCCYMYICVNCNERGRGNKINLNSTYKVTGANPGFAEGK